jgi:Toprim-like
MFTVGRAGGVFEMLGGQLAAPLVLVEGMFDALSVGGGGGMPCLATIGRWVDWPPEAARQREVWLAFDTNRPGERAAREFAVALAAAGGRCRRLRPPSGHGAGSAPSATPTWRSTTPSSRVSSSVTCWAKRDASRRCAERERIPVFLNPNRGRLRPASRLGARRRWPRCAASTPTRRSRPGVARRSPPLAARCPRSWR